MNDLKAAILIPFAFLTLFLTGCDVMQSGNDGPPEVQVQMKAEVSNIFAKQVMANQEIDGFIVNEVKFHVEELELESVLDDARDFELEDIIVNLPLDGSPFTITEKEIPVGVYDEFELEIEKAKDGFNLSDPDFRDANGSYSIVVKGEYEGEEFLYRSDEDFEIEMDLNPVLELNESGNSVLVISTDVDSWFLDSNGNVLDPNNSANISSVNRNIERSFSGFEDRFDDDDDDDDD
jgi:hypothetical protein